MNHYHGSSSVMVTRTNKQQQQPTAALGTLQLNPYICIWCDDYSFWYSPLLNQIGELPSFFLGAIRLRWLAWYFASHSSSSGSLSLVSVLNWSGKFFTRTRFSLPTRTIQFLFPCKMGDNKKSILMWMVCGNLANKKGYTVNQQEETLQTKNEYARDKV